MTRQNIFEILDSAYDITREFGKIQDLYSNVVINCTNPLNYRQSSYSIENYVDTFLLHIWKQRKSFLSVEEMKNCIFATITFEDIDKIETKLKILEYFINIIYLIESKGCTNDPINQFGKNFLFLKENINILLENLNYEQLVIKDEERVLLVLKDPAATAVAEISSEDTALAILKYNHASMKGDLEGKRNLLFSIYREYEPLLKQHIEGYADFYNKVRGLYNTLDIRHNNKTKEGNKNNVIDISDEELEKWYDELYQLLLFCVLIKDNLERKKEVDEFLKEIKKVD